MSTQMTVRVSDMATTHIDLQVADGFPSRAAYLTWLVEREARRLAEWQQLLRMREQGVPMDDPDTDAMIRATSGASLAHLD